MDPVAIQSAHTVLIRLHSGVVGWCDGACYTSSAGRGPGSSVG